MVSNPSLPVPFSTVLSRPKWSMGQRNPRLQFKVIITAVVLSVVLLVGLSTSSSNPYIASASRHFRNRVGGKLKVEDDIPNQVHYIWSMKDTSGDILFTFEQYLSVYSAWY
ncbi:glycosyl transferase [Colletotrichum higginsianum]|nr:glycosyl transferase [Colletotrichum higginsianum]